MDFLFDAIATVLAYLYDLTSSFGGSIMLLTLAVMVLVTPLTLKSTRSMIAMQQLQPELRKLQVKYKDDRQKLNEEMMAFYKEHNINPLGGCLPLVVQMPVFLVLYRVLFGMTKQSGYGEDMGRAVGLAVRDPDSGGRFEGFGTFDPGYLDHTTGLYRALDGVREMRSFGLDLADTFTNRLSEGAVAALPYLALVLLIGVTAWYQQRQIQARTAGNQPQINPQQQALMKIMPFFLPLFSLTLPAGIVLYFLVSNLFRIGQQAFITKTMYGDRSSVRPTSTHRGEGHSADSDVKGGTPRDSGGRAGGGKGAPTKGGSAKGSSGKGSTGPGGGKPPVPKGSPTPPRRDTVPTGSRSLFGGRIQLPARPSAAIPEDGVDDGRDATRSGGSARAVTGATKAPPRQTPARQAPPRQAPARPSNQNRSHKKKKRS